jgi:hypothetical protein
LPKVLEETNILKHSFDTYECLCPCNQCSGVYRSVYPGLELRFRCRCGCHRKQELARNDNGQRSSAYTEDRIYLETGIGIDASNLEASGV